MDGAIQSFIDSGVGLVLATAFHTLGAVGMLGGIVGYIAWHRHLRFGHHHARLLSASAAVTYVSILVNLVGGFMRTWEAGHPHLTQFMESPWVRAITLKHVFLFAGMAAAVWLFEVAAPRALKGHRAGEPEQADTAGHRVAVFLVLMGILMAGVLGAASRVTPFGDEPDEGAMPEPPAGGMEVRYENETGQLTSTPAAPASATGSFEVPRGGVSIEAALAWTPEQFDLTLSLTDPSGESTTFAPSGGNAGGAVENPAAGTWTYSVSSGFALDAQWQLSLEITAAQEGFVADTVVIQPGEFHEVNTQMLEGGTLFWNWTADDHLAFNVHSHFDGEVQDWVDLHAREDAGSYTNARGGGYSYLWENTGDSAVTLDYAVWGDFELDSIAG